MRTNYLSVYHSICVPTTWHAAESRKARSRTRREYQRRNESCGNYICGRTGSNRKEPGVYRARGWKEGKYVLSGRPAEYRHSSFPSCEPLECSPRCLLLAKIALRESVVRVRKTNGFKQISHLYPSPSRFIQTNAYPETGRKAVYNASQSENICDVFGVRIQIPAFAEVPES